MARQMNTLYFGQHKGQPISAVPTDYLMWVYGSFPKLRKKLRGVLEGRGLTVAQVQDLSRHHKVLGKEPESDEKRRKRLLKPRSGFKTPSNLNLRPARTYDYKADRKESFDEPPRIRTD